MNTDSNSLNGTNDIKKKKEINGKEIRWRERGRV